MAEFTNVFVQPSATVAVEFGKVFQRTDEPRQGEFLVVLTRPGFHGQQLAAFGVENEQQAIEKYQAVFVELASVFVRVANMILRAFGKTVGENFEDGEDAVAQIFFEFGLRAQGALADLVEPAPALSVARECRRTEQGDEKFEVFE